MMDPRITKHDRRSDFSYNLPHRIRCSAVYPLRAPNDSSVILYGYDHGLRILWRGGRSVARPKQPQRSRDSEVFVLDDNEDDILSHGDESKQEEQVETEAQSHNIVHDITIPLPSAVSRIAVPAISAQWPAAAKNQDLEVAVVVVSTITGQIILLRVPLALAATLGPSAAQMLAQDGVLLKDTGSYVRALSIRFFGETQSVIHVAAASEQLTLWRADLTEPAEFQQLDVRVGKTPTAVSFHPSARTPLLLMVDSCAACHLFEPQQDWGAAENINSPDAPGTWLTTFHAPYAVPVENALAARKRILDARWILNGRCILAIFDDGAWGIWEPSTSSTVGKAFGDLVISGYLDTTASLAPPSTKSGRLAPMTPNTRQAKSTSLFASPQPRSSNVAAKGGIAVSRAPKSVGSLDESVLIWFGGDVFSIPSMQTFWQRCTSTTGGIGSLSSPGITRIQSLALFQESITSISQLPAALPTQETAGVTRTPDFALSAESRLVIVQHSVRQSKGLFAPKKELQDQHMLDAGELDLGGMDRMLDSMAAIESRQRKVDFAH